MLSDVRESGERSLFFKACQHSGMEAARFLRQAVGSAAATKQYVLQSRERAAKQHEIDSIIRRIVK